MMVVSAELRVLAWNRSCERLYGWSAAEVIGQVLPVFPTVASRHRALQGATRLLMGDTPPRCFETVRMRRDGSMVMVEISVTPLRNPQGEPYAILASASEATKFGVLEEALSETQMTFRQMAETVSQVFWMTTLEGKELIYVNPAYAKLSGRDIQQLYRYPRTWLRSVHREDRSRILRALRERLDQGLFDEEFRIVRPDGVIRWMRNCASLTPFCEGAERRLVGVVEDVTEKRQALEGLVKSRDLLVETENITQVGSWEYDAILEQFTGSDEVRRMLGTGAVVTRENFYSLLHPDDRHVVQDAVYNKLFRGETYDIIYRIMWADGTYHTVRARGRVSPVATPSHPVYVGSIQDVTDQMRAQQERDDLIARLQDALDQVQTLRGLLPICGSCKSVRDDNGYWQRMDEYLTTHTDVEFSHGLCPSCLRKLYPDLADEVLAET
jgi:PAS domain S-box-containing protein